MLLQVRAQIIPIPVIRVIFRSNTTELPTKPAQMLTVIAIGVLHKQNIPKMLGENVCQTARLGKVCIFILKDLIHWSCIRTYFPSAISIIYHQTFYNLGLTTALSTTTVNENTKSFEKTTSILQSSTPNTTISGKEI